MNDLKQNIDLLRNLTDKVLQIQDIVKLESNRAEYKTSSGVCTGVALFNIGKIAVQHVTLAPNTELLPYMHDDCEEILVSYEGDLEVITKEDENRVLTTVINVGGLLLIRLGLVHIIKSVKGCKFIAITIPASPGYPKSNINE